MAADHAALELNPALSGDVLGGQSPEPGRHPVMRSAVPGQCVDDPPALLDLGQGVVGEFDPGAVPGDRDDLIRADRTNTDDDGMRILSTAVEIAARIEALAAEIARTIPADFVVVRLLKGATVSVADLARALDRASARSFSTRLAGGQA